MVRKSNGPRRKTRSKFRSSPRSKFTVNKFLKELEIGKRVVLKVDPSSRSIPFRRFHGLSGKVVERRGNAYIVEIYDGNKQKKVIARPEHLVG